MEEPSEDDLERLGSGPLEYDRLHAAQVADVITYRPRSAIREAAKALGHA